MFPAQAIPRAQVQTWKGGTGGDLQVVYWVGRRFSKEVGEEGAEVKADHRRMLQPQESGVTQAEGGAVGERETSPERDSHGRGVETGHGVRLHGHS